LSRDLNIGMSANYGLPDDRPWTLDEAIESVERSFHVYQHGEAFEPKKLSFCAGKDSETIDVIRVCDGKRLAEVSVAEYRIDRDYEEE
jgi:hypothetical protein